MHRPSARRHDNLPAHRIRLIGREQDLLIARNGLLGAEGRLMTFTGTGGCGKTRLALELAADVLARFPDGVWLVELAALSDPLLVPQTIVSALGIRERPGEPLRATLIRALSKRECLLVLDNCEHVIEVCARLVRICSTVAHYFVYLATSREALRIPGELTWRVPSLSAARPEAHGPTTCFDLQRSTLRRARAGIRVRLHRLDTCAAMARICSGWTACHWLSSSLRLG
jgi:predicted ATPase